MTVSMKDLQGEIAKLREDMKAALRVHLTAHHKYGEEAVDAVLSRL